MTTSHIPQYSSFLRGLYATETQRFSYISGFEIRPIRLSETCHNFSGQVKCPYMVIRRTSLFFVYNLKLELLKSRRDSCQCGRHRWRRCVSCACVARCSWLRSRFRVRNFWAIIRGVLSWDAVCQIRQRPVDAVFAAVKIGPVLVMFLRARRCFIFNQQNELCKWAQSYR